MYVSLQAVCSGICGRKTILGPLVSRFCIDGIDILKMFLSVHRFEPRNF
jgi:hypothetical protein